MKKALPFALLVSFFFSSFSQITYNISDVPVAPSTQRVAQDTFPLPSINFGNKGANQVYNFSNLVLFKYDTVEFRTPTSGQLSTCPNADVATTTDGINFILTNTDNANNKLTLEGFEGLISGNVLSAAYSTKPDLYRFPTNYQNTFSGTGYLQKTVPGSQVGQPLATSVELTINTTYTDTIDGWGKVITPVGAYKCLRKQRKETTNTLIRALVFGSWSTVSNDTKTTIRYTYITKEAKGSVINFNYDTGGVLQSVNWSMVPPTAPVADFSFVVGSNGSVAFTDLSDFYPTSWAWTFGDGGTSTQQNPTHVYTANGTYNVCLIATNAGGSSTQVCKQVVVTGVAVAPVAAFTWANPSGGLVNFTDQSTNSPASWAWTFGDGGTSTQQNPSHVYAANNTYNVCLTATNGAGNNTHCANVVVTNISAVNNSPVATDDTASVLQPNGLIRNVGTNDNDPDGNNICITAVYGSSAFSIAPTGNCTSIEYSPDSTYVGADSCYYIICDNGSPVKCDTAKFVVNSLYNSALLPVASFSGDFSFNHNTNIFDCQGGLGYDPNRIINTSINSDSVHWTFHLMNYSISCPDSIVYFSGDTLTLNLHMLSSCSNYSNIEVCMTVYNQFGSDSKCDTICNIIWEAINEISLSNISLYPNPSSSNITIDMSRNQDDITRNYSAIEIYNAIGEKVKLVGANNSYKVLNISVSDLTEGIYLATLVDAKGTRRTLGRFTVAR